MRSGLRRRGSGGAAPGPDIDGAPLDRRERDLERASASSAEMPVDHEIHRASAPKASGGARGRGGIGSSGLAGPRRRTRTADHLLGVRRLRRCRGGLLRLRSGLVGRGRVSEQSRSRRARRDGIADVQAPRLSGVSTDASSSRAAAPPRREHRRPSICSRSCWASNGFETTRSQPNRSARSRSNGSKVPESRTTGIRAVARVALDRLAHLVAVLLGHDDVGEDQVGERPPRATRGPSAVGDAGQLVVRAGERQLDDLLDRQAVVGEQNLLSHEIGLFAAVKLLGSSGCQCESES